MRVKIAAVVWREKQALQVEVHSKLNLSKIDHLFVLLSETNGKREFDYGEEIDSLLADTIKRAAFTGRSDESITILNEKPRKITLVGLGKKKPYSPRTTRTALYAVAKAARRARDQRIAVIYPHQIEGLDAEKSARLFLDLLMHSDYRYEAYLNTNEENPRLEISAVYLLPRSIPDSRGKRLLREARIVADGVRLARELGNAPPNELTPTALADRARDAMKQAGVKCSVFDLAAIKKLNMGGLLAVNRGAREEPRFVVMEYTPKKAKKTVCLVGKGITFDSGGISIKPAERMDEMKFDMCGAAAVIAIMQVAAQLELPVRLIGLTPATENLPSGSAYKPGDIIRMMSGKTVEIVNTDAEGRMILADALHYARRYKPDHVIDYATLTGACVVALGHEATGLFSNDRSLAQKLITAGDRVGERLWELPEWDEYKDYFRSDWADMKNSGGRWGGAISAALFLKEFVDCPSWAHLDIAGTAWTENETSREAKGATGVGVRATIDFLESLS